MKILFNSFNIDGLKRLSEGQIAQTAQNNASVSYPNLKPLEKDTVSFSGRKTLIASDMSIAPSVSNCAKVNKDAEPARFYLNRILDEYIGPYVDTTDTLDTRDYPVLACKVRVKSPLSIREKVVSKYSAAYSKMATTLTGMLFTGERWFLFHVGNCRAYTWRSPYLNQLTKDHTWANEMRLLGMPEDEIESSGRSSEIISCLGNGDVSTAKRLCVTDVTGEITEASRIILTCDGIHDFMTNGELEQGINSMDNIPELLQLSMHFVRENGSQDDLSMLVIDMK